MAAILDPPSWIFITSSLQIVTLFWKLKRTLLRRISHLIKVLYKVKFPLTHFPVACRIPQSSFISQLNNVHKRERSRTIHGKFFVCVACYGHILSIKSLKTKLNLNPERQPIALSSPLLLQTGHSTSRFRERKGDRVLDIRDWLAWLSDTTD